MTRRGFNLIEVLLAVAIVAVALITLIGVLTYGMQMLSRSREVYVANEIGRQLMEKIRLETRTTGFSALPGGAYVFDGRVPDPASGGFPPAPYPGQTWNGGNYQLVVTGAQSDARLKSVTVDVYWGPTQKISLTSLYHP